MHTNRTLIYTLFAISFLGALFNALPAYINSTFLVQFISEAHVGYIFTIGSLIAIIAFILIPQLLSHLGNYWTFLCLTLLGIASFVGIALFPITAVVILLFVLYQTVNRLMTFSIDLFLEHYSDDEHTGRIRGLYFTAINLAWLIAPITAGLILAGTHFMRLYLIAGLILIPTLPLLMWQFKDYIDPIYPRIPFWKTALSVAKNKSLTKIFTVSLLLRSFYAVMVIYTPLYLNQYMGIGWDAIGVVFTIMLLPFVLFPRLLGKLADTRFGEKEMLAIGFLIMAITTITLSFITTSTLWIWAVVLFMTRVGASTVDIMTESYFFKQIDSSDSDELSLFRITQPAGWLIAPALASVILGFIPLQFIFLIIGTVMFCGIYFSLTLKDTR